MEPIALPDWAALGPALVLAVTALLLFVVDAVNPRKTNRPLIAGTATVGSLAALAVAVWYLLAGVGTPTGEGGRGEFHIFGDPGQFVIDEMALFFMVVVAVVTAMVAVASYDYMHDHAYFASYYSLVLLAATGMATMAAANSLVTIFIALELASLPSYALVAILKDNRGSVEGGLKYFLVGALSSAVMVYGISLVYGATGHLQLEAIAEVIAAGDAEPYSGLLGLGVLMLIGGFAFKTASVPFHFWAPEAYEGAPAPVAAFLSSASKAAGFVIAFRVFTTALPIGDLAPMGIDWATVFVVLAIVTMTVGNFAAAVQENVKRMLAYSSIGHAGYALIGLAGFVGPGGSELVMSAAMMHLLVYGFMNTGAFLFVGLAEYWGVGRTFEDYNGLATQAPIACSALAVFMFSLAGIPPFGGFWSKYFLFTGALSVGSTAMIAVAAALVVNSALSLYYYSRLVKAVWIEDPVPGREGLSQPVGLYAAIVFAAVMTVAVLPGFGPIADAATSAATALIA